MPVFLAPRTPVTLTVILGGTPGRGSISLSDSALWMLLGGCCNRCRADQAMTDLLEEIDEKCEQRASDPTLWLSVHSRDLPARHHGGTVVAVRETEL